MAIFFIILLTIISGIYSASETALFSLSSLEVRSYKKHHDKNKQLISRLLKHPLELLVTILMVNVLVNILIQNVASNIFGLYSNWLLTVGVPLVLTLLFGEILPKTIAMLNNTQIASWVAPLIAFSRFILGPLRIALTFLTNYLTKFFFFFMKPETGISKEELKSILKTSEKKGILQTDETILMQGYINLQDTLVKEIMRPREEILFFDIQDPLSHLTHLFVDEEVSHLPVCEDGLENIIGIITVQEFFIHKEECKDSKDILKFLHNPFFIPENIPAIQLLNLLRLKEEPVTLVVDEYGSISGLITKEDLVEIVVGQISDRRDEQVRFTYSSDNTIIASGKLELTEFNHIFDIPLESKNNMATLGGWLIEQLDTIPQAGTKYKTKDFIFHVLAADPNRVRRVFVKKIKPHNKEPHA